MKKYVPIIVVAAITLPLAVFIIWQIIHSTSHEELFEEACASSCIGYSSATVDSGDFKSTTYSRGNPSTVIILNKYKKSKDATAAFESRSVQGIGNIPEDGYTQNMAHNTKVYFIHNRHNNTYYCCGLIGGKLVFGMRSSDGNYFSQQYTLIRDTYFNSCIDHGM